MQNLFKSLKKIADALSLPCEVHAIYHKERNETRIRIWWHNNYFHEQIIECDYDLVKLSITAQGIEKKNKNINNSLKKVYYSRERTKDEPKTEDFVTKDLAEPYKKLLK